MDREREKKVFVPNYVPSRAMLENSKKNGKKIQKIKKNIFPAIFLSKMGWDRMTKIEKKFCPEFRSYTTRARKFPKTTKKKIKKKNHSTIFFYPNRVERGRERVKKISFQIPFLPDLV